MPPSCAVDFERQRRSVDNFFIVESRERAAGDVAGHVPASSGGGQAGLPESLQEVGKGFDGDPVQLNILAHGNVGDTAAVLFREMGDGADLFAAQQTVGDANTHHEKRQGLAFAVFAAESRPGHRPACTCPRNGNTCPPFRRDGLEAVAGELLNLVEMVPGVFGALEALDALGLGFRRPLAQQFWFG